MCCFLDDSDLEMPPVHDKDENRINGTSSCISSQEIETDKILLVSEISQIPEQEGATGTNLLVEEIYLGPINLNNEEEEES